MYLPTYKKYQDRIERLHTDPSVSIWIVLHADRPIGMLALRKGAYGCAEIEGIAVREA